ncbi:MAG: diguanylate cyclase [Chloroflexi bacterium]|jgi:diguanylate cyclase (GGDEF)-like protein|nr:MAG: diguanylate cyclase [Chloroflexota bacterium]
MRNSFLQRLLHVRRFVWDRRPHLIWLLVAGVIAVDLPSGALHAPLTIAAVFLAAGWSHAFQRRRMNHSLRWARIEIGKLRNRSDTFERAATIDPVTGLANRQAFYSKLSETLAKPLHGVEAPALLLIDLDRFKVINDTYGHAAGDAVLMHMARVLQEETRPADLVGRLGGDEFGVLLHRTTADALPRMLQRIQRAAGARPLHTMRNGVEIFGSLSVGGVMLWEYPDIDAALMAADRGLYADKERLGANPRSA